MLSAAVIMPPVSKANSTSGNCALSVPRSSVTTSNTLGRPGLSLSCTSMKLSIGPVFGVYAAGQSISTPMFEITICSPDCG